MKKQKSTLKPLTDNTHDHPKENKSLKSTSPGGMVTVTLILRRRTDGSNLREIKDFTAKTKTLPEPMDRERFAAEHGAHPDEIESVSQFATSNGLQVVETNLARRTVVVRGTVAKINTAFKVKLHDYQSPRGKYHGHDGAPVLPASIAKFVEAIIGLDNRPIKATPFNTSHRQSKLDPPNTKPLTPQEVAQLYSFPAGNGAGQTIGIYEMATEGQNGQLQPAGYLAKDVADTLKGFGGGLKVPNIIDVPIDGTGNSGVNDGETLLDITVSGAIAQAATIAVYFAGAQTQNMIHALQTMIHPGAGDPAPTVISISYGWGPDDAQQGFSKAEFAQFGQLFLDAANLNISVFVSSGDSGAFIESQTIAQASYPATEPMVTACGGTTIGNVSGSTFTEYAWNDGGATGGGISGRFPVPSYQAKAKVPVRNSNKKTGRGIPDVAGNASPYSGYMQSAGGSAQPIGGTSAVAPLYAALIALINSNLNASVGFINPVIYSLGNTAFRDTVAPPGPLNNSSNGVVGYPVTVGWDACTGFGSVKGTALQNGLKAAKTGSKMPA